jgi:mRNA degradation ribonuclease J1/J2
MLSNTYDNEKQIWVYVGPDCTAQKCVPECPFFPDTGEMIRNSKGEIFFHYDDSNLEEGFYGTAQAVMERRKIAAMTPKQLDEYRRIDQEGKYWNQPAYRRIKTISD